MAVNILVSSLKYL